MPESLTCDQVRQIDQDAIRELGLPSLLLMENASRGVCDAILSQERWNTISIVCGPGNNGGDGLAVARQLAANGIESRVLLHRGDKKVSADASENMRYLQSSGIQVTEPHLSETQEFCKSLAPQDLIVDALLGTGIRGIVKSPFSEIIDAINGSSAKVLAIDIPSGLDSDSGLPCGTCVCAQRTITFVAMKQGFLREHSQKFTGDVQVCHIGIPRQWIEAWYQQFSEQQTL